MRGLLITLFTLLVICFIQARRPSPEPAEFVASSPCDMMPRTMLGIPPNADCELIKWNLALQRDPRNQEPTFYKLTITYGMSQLNTTGFKNGGNHLEKSGNWVILKDTNGREIYRLNPDTPEQVISFAKLDDRLLHLLDSQGKLMIGHAAWSYTLNRK
ncbi:copper resistance protein NlpE N-terminal domain-containing protein [Spirosoma gilvum]